MDVTVTVNIPKGARVLVLEDDIRCRWPTFQSIPGTILTCHPTPFKEALKESFLWDVVFLDHDMDENGPCDQAGKCAARALAEHFSGMPNKLPLVVIHSQNNHGAMQMENFLEWEGFQTFQIPFNKLSLRIGDSP